jgi:N4-gp56 family major capsid protein
MANAYTDILSGLSLGVNLVQTAYDRLVEFQLRALPHYRSIVDKRPAQQAMPGSSVVFNLYQDLAAVSTPLVENVDPDSVAIPQTTNVTVTLNEYGNAALATRKLRLFTLSDVDPAIADVIAFNMADSLDGIILTEARQGTNVIRRNGGNVVINGGTTVAVTATDVINSAMVRATTAKLRSGKALPRIEQLYAGFVHPDVSVDLRSEAGASSAGWRPPHEYSSAGNIWGGVIGAYEGVMWTETPRTYFAADGASSGRVHRSLIFGRQAIAEAVAEEPHTIIGPVVDKLMRFRPIGWYGVIGWKRYREAAIVRLENASSIATV